MILLRKVVNILTINERIRYLRKETLNITQEALGEPLGLTRANIANIESGRIAVTDRVIISICEKFDVNENWLRTGEGEILVELSEEEEIANLVSDLLDPRDDIFYLAVLELVHTYKELSPSSQLIIRETASKFLDNFKKRRGN